MISPTGTVSGNDQLVSNIEFNMHVTDCDPTTASIKGPITSQDYRADYRQ